MEADIVRVVATWLIQDPWTPLHTYTHSCSTTKFNNNNNNNNNITVCNAHISVIKHESKAVRHLQVRPSRDGMLCRLCAIKSGF